MTIQELCKEYEVPSHMMWLLDSAAVDYQRSRDSILHHLRTLERESIKSLNESVDNTRFWRNCHSIAIESQRMTLAAAEIELISTQVVTLIHLCATEITFRLQHGQELSDQFKNAARSMIFGVQS